MSRSLWATPLSQPAAVVRILWSTRFPTIPFISTPQMVSQHVSLPTTIFHSSPKAHIYSLQWILYQQRGCETSDTVLFQRTRPPTIKEHQERINLWYVDPLSQPSNECSLLKPESDLRVPASEAICRTSSLTLLCYRRMTDWLRATETALVSQTHGYKWRSPINKLEITGLRIHIRFVCSLLCQSNLSLIQNIYTGALPH